MRMPQAGEGGRKMTPSIHITLLEINMFSKCGVNARYCVFFILYNLLTSTRMTLSLYGIPCIFVGFLVREHLCCLLLHSGIDVHIFVNLFN